MMRKIPILLIFALALAGCSFFNDDATVYPDAFSEDTGLHLYYQQLDDSQKIDYQNIYNCLAAYGNQVEISPTDTSQLQPIVDAVIFDNPEIFYMANCTLNQKGDKYYFQPQYLFDQNQVTDYQQQLQDVAATITQNIVGENEYDQIVYLYEYIINHNEYVTNSDYNQTVVSSMIYGETVCAGYATMFQYLGDYLGLDVGSMVGTSIETAENPSQYHQWNVILYDGDYYYLDATWGDALDGLLYDYCMYSSDTMVELYEPIGEVFETEDLTNTYFQINDLYIEDYSRAQVEEIIRRSTTHAVSIQFSDSAYYLAKRRLISQQEIFTVLQNTGHLTNNIDYLTNDVTKTIYVEY